MRTLYDSTKDRRWLVATVFIQLTLLAVGLSYWRSGPSEMDGPREGGLHGEFHHVTGSDETIPEWAYVVDPNARGSPRCRPDCDVVDFFQGLAGRRFSSECKQVRETGDSTWVELPTKAKPCTHPIFAEYDRERREVTARCPTSDVVDVVSAPPLIVGDDPNVYWCSTGGVCQLERAPTASFPTGVPFSVDAAPLDGGPIVLYCDGQINVVASASFVDEAVVEERAATRAAFGLKPGQAPDVYFILTDATSRFQALSGWDAVRDFLEARMADRDGGSSDAASTAYQFLQHNSHDEKTTGNVPQLISGCPPKADGSDNWPDLVFDRAAWPPDQPMENLFEAYKRAGYLTFETGVHITSFFNKGNQPQTIVGEADHSRRSSGYGFGLDDEPNGGVSGGGRVRGGEKLKCFVDTTEPFAQCKCVGGKFYSAYYFDHLQSFVDRRDAVAPDAPVFAWIHELSNHNRGGEGPQAIDRALAAFLSSLDLSRSVVVLLGDHAAPRWVRGKRYWRNAYFNPVMMVLAPQGRLTPEAHANLAANQDASTTHFDVHRTVKELPRMFRDVAFAPLAEGWGSGLAPPGSINLMTDRVPIRRHCKDANVKDYACLCATEGRLPYNDAYEINQIVAQVMDQITASVDLSICWPVSRSVFTVEKPIYRTVPADGSGTRFELTLVSKSSIPDDRFVAKEPFKFRVVAVQTRVAAQGTYKVTSVARDGLYAIEQCSPRLDQREACLCRDGNRLGDWIDG